MIPSISPRFGNAVLAAAKKHLQRQHTSETRRNQELAAEEKKTAGQIQKALQKIGYNDQLDAAIKEIIEEALILWDALPKDAPPAVRKAIESTLTTREINLLMRHFFETKRP